MLSADADWTDDTLTLLLLLLTTRSVHPFLAVRLTAVNALRCQSVSPGDGPAESARRLSAVPLVLWVWVIVLTGCCCSWRDVDSTGGFPVMMSFRRDVTRCLRRPLFLRGPRSCCTAITQHITRPRAALRRLKWRSPNHLCARISEPGNPRFCLL